MPSGGTPPCRKGRLCNLKMTLYIQICEKWGGGARAPDASPVATSMESGPSLIIRIESCNVKDFLLLFQPFNIKRKVGMIT